MLVLFPHTRAHTCLGLALCGDQTPWNEVSATEQPNPSSSADREVMVSRNLLAEALQRHGSPALSLPYTDR